MPGRSLRRCAGLCGRCCAHRRARCRGRLPTLTLRRRASAPVSRHPARVRAVLPSFQVRHRVRAEVGLVMLGSGARIVSGDRSGGDAMQMTDKARGALCARGSALARVLDLNGKVDAMRSPWGLTSAAEGSESIIEFLITLESK